MRCQRQIIGLTNASARIRACGIVFRHIITASPPPGLLSRPRIDRLGRHAAYSRTTRRRLGYVILLPLHSCTSSPLSSNHLHHPNFHRHDLSSSRHSPPVANRRFDHRLLRSRTSYTSSPMLHPGVGVSTTFRCRYSPPLDIYLGHRALPASLHHRPPFQILPFFKPY